MILKASNLHKKIVVFQNKPKKEKYIVVDVEKIILAHHH
jgi:hypothetical protein